MRQIVCLSACTALCYTWSNLRGLHATEVRSWTSSLVATGISAGRRGDAVETLTPEAFWRVFETTGSIWAYLIYRQLLGRRRRWVVPILN